jgi:tetratricopeptide (TPR) repeat protein
MEVIALSNRQPLLTHTWRLNHIVNAEDPITLEFRMGSNYEFECRAFLTNRPEELFQRTVENPLTNVVNPSKVRMEIEELEGEIRGKGGPSADDRAKLLKLARSHAELKQLEKAQDYLRVALRVLDQPDAEILMLQGIYHGEVGDLERETKAYREADRVAPYWGGPMFNLALSLRAQKKYVEALEAVEKALQKEPDEGAFLTLKGLCLQSLHRAQEAQSTFLKAANAFGPVKDLNEWELGWCETCARMLSDSKLLEEVQKERKSRQAPEPVKPAPVERPKLMGALQRHGS